MSKPFLTVFGRQLAREVLQGNFKIFETVQFYSKWKASLQDGKNSITDEQPWITFHVLELLKEWIKPDTKVFEYGGGGSTLFFVNRVQELVTVEHDPEWFTTLEKSINDKKTNNWTGRLVLPETRHDQVKLNPSDPQHYFSGDKAFSNNTFRNYARFIDQYPDAFFDIVLVDGRVRPSCVWHSVPKIKKDGYLVIDNSDRKYYFPEIDKILEREFALVYNNKGLSPYVDFLTQTGVWRKL